MCNPVAVMAVMTVASAVGAKETATNTQQAANNALGKQYQQINEKQGQINQQSALDQSERDKQGLLERAKMATISGESGALGISSDRLLSDSFMQEGTDISSLEKNRVNAIKQTGWEGTQAQASAQSTINTAAAKAPSVIGTGLQIGTDYLTLSSGSKTKAKATV